MPTTSNNCKIKFIFKNAYLRRIIFEAGRIGISNKLGAQFEIFVVESAEPEYPAVIN